MKTIITHAETKSALNLIMTFIEVMPKGKISPTSKSAICKALEIYSTVEVLQDSDIEELQNILYKECGAAECLTIDNDGSITIETDEQMFIGTVEIMNDNIDTIIGIGMTIYGILNTLKSTLKKMLTKFDKLNQEVAKKTSSAE